MDRVAIFTDRIPVNKNKRAVEKAIKLTLTHKLPKDVSYYAYHHESKSNYDLQIVDYCNWAIYRKWTNDDLRSYEIIKDIVKSEFDIFQIGSKFFY